MKIVKFKYVFLLLSFLYPLNSSWCMESDVDIVDSHSNIQPMPFKLGFEFQEANNLCRWAKPGDNIQKKSLFFMEEGSIPHRRLWTVVIDGQDIEFVLEPFSHTEYDLLEQSVSSVLMACEPLTQQGFDENDLKQALSSAAIERVLINNNFPIMLAAGLRKSENPRLSSSFEIWKSWLKSKEKYHNTPDEEFIRLWETPPLAPFDPNRLFSMAEISKKESITFMEWLNEIKELTAAEGNFRVQEDDQYFKEVENARIQKRQELKFQPQATIQYPLEYSIPLFFSLFEFKAHSPAIVKLLNSLPFLDEINSNDMERYFKKKIGLVFLHALTLSEITTKNSDVDLLHKIQERHDHTKQVDAKGTLNFMSRRPFSDMWVDVKEENDDFWTIYRDSMQSNRVFVDKFFNNQGSGETEWLNNLYPNYAEEFSSEAGPRNLTALTDCFTESFLNACNDAMSNPLPNLLGKGILSTTMIRNLDPQKVSVSSLDQSQKTPQQIFESYYSQSVQSIQSPTSRYTFDLDEKHICEQKYRYDALSPPWFLNDNDAMGFFRDYALRYPQDIQKYGEGIIEVRNIKYAFTEKKDFLTKENRSLLADTRKLFSFLKETNKEKVLSELFKSAMLNCVLQKKEN